MPLDQILDAIEKKADEKIKEAAERSEKELLSLEKDYSDKFKQKQKDVKSAFQRDLENKMLEIQKGFELKKMFSIQEEKKRALDEAFALASEKISKGSEKKLKDILSKMVVALPDAKGVIKAGKASCPIIKSIIKNKEIEMKDGLSEEGFIFSSKIVDIDFRISQALSQSRERLEAGVLKILFEQ